MSQLSKPQTKKLMRIFLERVQKGLYGVQMIIDREEDTPHSLEMDFTLSSLTILLSLQRLLEYYEGQVALKGSRNFERWTEQENDYLKFHLSSSKYSHIMEISKKLGRTPQAVREQALKLGLLRGRYVKMKDIKDILIGKTIKIETCDERRTTVQMIKVESISLIQSNQEKCVVNKGLPDEWETDRTILEGLTQGWRGTYYPDARRRGKTVDFSVIEEK